MKLDVAVENVAAEDVAVGNDVAALGVGIRIERRGRSIARAIAGSAIAVVLLAGGPVLALDGIDLMEPAEATADGECPRLIQIKYPFLECKSGEIGLADGDATWENSRQIPRQSDFTEGNGYWGNDLNRD